MRKDVIKRHIDNRILKDLPTIGPDALRNDLAKTCRKFSENIVEKATTPTEDNIEKIEDVRSRYLSLYVFYAQQRIIDLYKIETKNLYGWSLDKKFKALLFKEKLEGRV